MTLQEHSQTESSDKFELDKFRNQGRISGSAPVAVIDIGSNSVRLVMYERASRAPIPMYNEKQLCGLGKGVAGTGKLNEKSVACALKALKRFRFMIDHADVGTLYVLATAAARDASNGADFMAEVEAICGVVPLVLSGEEEAQKSAMGVVSAIRDPDGVVGDLGGGSLEMITVKGAELGKGSTYPLGGLRIQDTSGGSLKQAQKIAKTELSESKPLDKLEGKTFYAIGGTWRALGKLHMASVGYPLKVMHHYSIDAEEAMEFCRQCMRDDIEDFSGIGAVSKARRNLLPYGAAVLHEVLKRGKPKRVVISSLGVREGHLFEQLPEDVQAQDPLLVASEELCVLRSRSPFYAHELADWLDGVFEALAIEESAYERKLRRAACLLADIGWRAHPDYRGTQSLNIIAHGSFIGIDHPGRAYLAMSNYFRHEGLSGSNMSLRMWDVSSLHLRSLARTTGAALRLAHVAVGELPGILPRLSVTLEDDVATLHIPPELDLLRHDKLERRFSSFVRLMGYDSRVESGEG
ncbi:exopolyphosphatase / guanosine-5'-triphosphate,3'-diphosphate pyrophosphatase [Cohaesibacter sp. ES.047]|uniref:Ppx/GppA family phosphatase n=1 Tax=Cohaesibacter sp. ES.047 TaxID=1798205 RepID=UPI000BB6F6F6|nr:Ppx/GppA phosphatase family protein [Cohaesibacter sp. ES.047]SNY93806.1 exopolyphosphatase / guanosine-5'-triphosphate,3'-diphosphate pyrophosphatase [Cohaesibacter sp. ES.047]